MFRRKSSKNKVLHFDPENMAGASRSREAIGAAAAPLSRPGVPVDGPGAPSAPSAALPRKADAPPGLRTFGDATNREVKPAGAASWKGGWLSGPVDKDRVLGLAGPDDVLPVRSGILDAPQFSPAQPCRRLSTGNVPQKKREPRIGADGVLMFSDDESENSFACSPSPRRVARHSVGGRPSRQERLKRDAYRPAPVSPTPAELKGGPRAFSRAPATKASTSTAMDRDVGLRCASDDSLDDMFTDSARPLRSALEDTKRPDHDDGAAAAHDDPLAPTVRGQDRPSLVAQRARSSADTSSLFHRCIVVRKNRGKYKFLQRYLLFVERGDDSPPELLLMARKQNIGKHSNYLLFNMQGFDPKLDVKRESPRYLGKLVTSGKKANIFTLFARPAEAGAKHTTELCAVTFKAPSFIKKLRSHVGPRMATVVLPTVSEDGSVSTCHSLAQRMKSNMLEGLTVMTTKQPSIINGVYQLNFGGRVKVASIKNFQMVHPTETEDVRIQFGKVSGDAFVLDFQAPLSACQALSIALAQFLV